MAFAAAASPPARSSGSAPALGCGEPRPRGSHRGDVGFSVRCGNGACAPRAGAPISDPARWCSSNGHAGSETGAPQFGRSRRLQAAGTGSEFSSAAIWSRHRGAMSAISRGSRSGATIPPEARQIFATPGGVAASSVRGLASFQDAAASRRDSGGVARALNPRLMDGKPPACRRFALSQLRQRRICVLLLRESPRSSSGTAHPRPRGSQRGRGIFRAVWSGSSASEFGAGARRTAAGGGCAPH